MYLVSGFGDGLNCIPVPLILHKFRFAHLFIKSQCSLPVKSINSAKANSIKLLKFLFHHLNYWRIDEKRSKNKTLTLNIALQNHRFEQAFQAGSD